MDQEQKWSHRIVHGSPDSLDLDVIYLFSELPPFEDSKLFCLQDKVILFTLITISQKIET